jgi:hypothetical protein
LLALGVTAEWAIGRADMADAAFGRRKPECWLAYYRQASRFVAVASGAAVSMLALLIDRTDVPLLGRFAYDVVPRNGAARTSASGRWSIP